MNRKTLLSALVLSVLFTAAAFSQPMPVYKWASSASDSTFNHNPSETVVSPIELTVPHCGRYTLVAVYTTGEDTAERSVWALDYGAEGSNGLTTRKLTYAGISATYDSVNRRGPVINSLMQSSPVDDTLLAPDSVTLRIGGDTSAGGGLRTAEVMYFDRRLGFSALRKVQTHLAVKYGVTLGAGDYVAPDGRRVWVYRRDSTWHRRITGVGVDSVYGLHQLTSRSGHEGAVLTLAADSLREGEYCIIGDDGAPMEYAEDSLYGMELLQRTWKARVTGSGDTASADMAPTFRLVFSMQGTGAEGDTMALLVDGVMYRPDSVINGDNHYSGVAFPSDTALLQLARAQMPEITGRSATMAHGTETTVSLYPNPCRGRYTVTVGGCGSVDIEVHNALGVKVGEFRGSDRGMYRFDGEVPSAGVYFITVTADGEKRTLKMVAE